MPHTPIAKLTLTAVDCPDPRALAAFYSSITGWPVSPDSDDDWVWLESGIGTTLAFQRSPDHRPPTWPDGERPQQLHLDFDVPDLDAGEVAVLALGAVKHAHQPGETFRVYLDPAGHPFCLVLRRPAE